MSGTNISGSFSLESKNGKITKHNLVVNTGIKQLFNWFKLSDYVNVNLKHNAGEKIFSKNGVEKINLKDSLITISENAKDSTSNLTAILNGWDNSCLTSEYSSSDEDRTIVVSFKKSKEEELTLNLKGIALYGKRTTGHSSYPLSYPCKISLIRKNGSKIAKKTFETPILLSPYNSSSDKINFSKDDKFWAGSRFYTYFTFDEMFDNEKNWYLVDDNGKVSENIVDYEEFYSGKEFQKSITLEKPYYEDICGIEITDRYGCKIQINELDIYTYRPDVFFNAPSFFNIGTEKTAPESVGEDIPEFEYTDLENPIDEKEKIPVEEIKVLDNGNICYIGYIPEKYSGAKIKEVGIFYEQDNKTNMFARTVLDESFEVPKESFVRIVYELEIK